MLLYNYMFHIETKVNLISIDLTLKFKVCRDRVVLNETELLEMFH